MNKNIILIGFMGTGKTTIGRRVAGKLGMDFYDTDEYIKRCENMSVSEIVAKKGTKYFEGAQRFAVTNLCESENTLIATGGSTVSDERCRAALAKNGIFVWLKATPETIFENTKNSRNKRPELAGKTLEELAVILKESEKDYENSDIVIDVDISRDIDVLADAVVEKIEAYMA